MDSHLEVTQCGSQDVKIQSLSNYHYYCSLSFNLPVLLTALGVFPDEALDDKCSLLLMVTVSISSSISTPQDITCEAAIYVTTFTLDLYVLKYVSP